jgi:hypothetical protein
MRLVLYHCGGVRVDHLLLNYVRLFRGLKFFTANACLLLVIPVGWAAQHIRDHFHVDFLEIFHPRAWEDTLKTIISEYEIRNSHSNHIRNTEILSGIIHTI